MPYPGEPVPTPTDPEVEFFGLRAEALRSLDPNARAAWWRAAWDECFAALGNRCTRPIVTMSDDWLRSLIARMGDAETLGWTRGFKPVAGQDAWVEAEVKRIREDFELLALGRRLPVYTDSTPTKDEKSPRLSANEKSSDEWFMKYLKGCGCSKGPVTPNG
jgi:hypothetical protein